MALRGAGGLHSHGKGIRHSSMTAVSARELSSKSLWVKTGGNFGPSGASDLSEQLPGAVRSSLSCRSALLPATLQVKPLPG